MTIKVKFVHHNVDNLKTYIKIQLDGFIFLLSKLSNN